jgi:hypothetical protein
LWLPYHLQGGRRRQSRHGRGRRDEKAPGCLSTLHVRDLPVFDHREALRPSTRLLPPNEEEYEES